MPEPSPPDRRAPQSRLAALRGREDPALTPDPRFWGDDRISRSRSSSRDRGSKSRPARERARVAPRDTFLDAARDRWLTWRGDARLGVVGLLVVAGIAGVVWYRIGTAGSAAAPPAPRAVPTSVPGADPVTPTTKAGDGVVVVHVAGAVTHPGVVELAAGARVIDAVEAAGGGLPEADLDRLNLASRLIDGQQVLVARIGDPPTPGSTATPATPGVGSTAPTLVNLNTATQAELETLPGIGPALATAILDERERRGGFGSVNELREVRGIGEKRFADLRDKVTV